MLGQRCTRKPTSQRSKVKGRRSMQDTSPFIVEQLGRSRGSRGASSTVASGLSRTMRRVRRVAQMPLAEVACRSRQAALKWVERLAGDAAFDAESILRAQHPTLADA